MTFFIFFPAPTPTDVVAAEGNLRLFFIFHETHEALHKIHTFFSPIPSISGIVVTSPLSMIGCKKTTNPLKIMVVSSKHFKMSEPHASQHPDNYLRGCNEEKSLVRPMLIVKGIHYANHCANVCVVHSMRGDICLSALCLSP
jgi:hypothetical protein